MTADEHGPEAPLVLVRGDASAEEVAALVAVLRVAAAAGAAGSAAAEDRPPAEWSAPRRRLRGPFAPPATGPGAWRSSGLPR